MKNKRERIEKPLTLRHYVLAMTWIFGITCTIAQTAKPPTNTTPTVDEAVKQMQQGKRFNLKKIIEGNTATEFSAKEDNPDLRAAFDLQRLANPLTGEIPKDIREKELMYVNSERSHLQDRSLQQRNTIYLESAPGDQSSPWVNRGPFNVGGRTRALALDLNDEDRILAGGVSGGLWESLDAGATWSRITPAAEHPSITDIVQDPRPGFQNIWYYCTGERLGNSASARNGSGFYQGNGIYKSIDNGDTFLPLATTVNSTPQTFSSGDPFDLNFGIVVHPTTGDVYVATFAGIWRSTNGGTSFSQVLEGEFDNISDIHVTSNGVLYATLDSDNDGTTLGVGGVFRATDGASGTWENITPGSFPASFGRVTVRTAPSNEDVLYLFASNTPSALGHDFWKFTFDAGDTDGIPGVWENRTANLPAFGGSVGNTNTQGGYDQYVRIHPNNENLVFIGTTNIYRSFDGFATATPSDAWIGGYSPLNNVSLYTNHHPDQHNLLFLPSDPDQVISAHDGGLSFTTDIQASSGGTEPVAWSSLNNGYLTTQVYALSFGPGDQIMAGFQDNSTWLTTSSSGTATWTDQFSGDGSYNAFSQDGTSRYVSAQLGTTFRLEYASANSDIPTSFQSITPSGAGGFLFVNPFELDPNNDEIMYLAGGTLLWRNDQVSTATNTAGWASLTNAAAQFGPISTIGISTLPANVVYIGTTAGEIYRIDDADTGNPSAVDVYTGSSLPVANVSSIAVDPTDASNVIATFSNYGVQSIFYSEDSGGTWTNISGNLEENADGSGSGPSVRWLDIVGLNDVYLVGTSTGLYSTDVLNGASTIWTQVDPTGIGNVVVEQVRSREDGLVVVGTHGNGLYSANFEVSVGVSVANPVTDIEVSSNAADLDIDVSNVFVSDNIPSLDIDVSVESNSNSSLVSTSIVDDLLTLSFALDAFGEATITLRGEDTNGSAALTSFNVAVLPSAISSFPYIESFDNDGGNLPSGWSVSNTGAYAWLLGSGETTSPGTGPLGDNTSGSGFYAFTEASSPAAPGEQTTLLSREIDLSSLSSARLRFNYHMFGETIGSLDVNVVTTTNANNIFSITGQQQVSQSDGYIEVLLSLDAFLGEVVQIAFVGTRGGSFTGDIAIDDIVVEEQPNDDLAVASVTPDELVFGNESITVLVRNEGANDQSSFELAYFVDDVEIQRETINSSLLSGEELEYTFSTTFDFSTPDEYALGVEVVLAGDEIASNDELTLTVVRSLFTGDYQMVQLNGPSPFDTYTFSGDGIDEIFININQDGDFSFEEVTLEPLRIANALTLAPQAFSFVLDDVSDDVVFNDSQATGLSFSNSPILLGTADEQGRYVDGDESSFFMTIKDDVSGLSGSAVDVRFKLYQDVELFVFEGNTSDAWDEASNWSTGEVPGSDDIVVISTLATFQPVINADVEVEDLIIQFDISLTIASGSMKVNNDFINEGLLFVTEGASIVLLGERSGSGETQIERSISIDGALSIFGLPVEELSVEDIEFSHIFDYDNNTQNFFVPSSGTVITPGKGYFGSAPSAPYPVRGPLSWGTVNTGVTLGLDGFNMVANPYGAAIDATSFFANVDNTNNTTGTAYLWNDGGVNLFPQNLRGGDYITINSLGVAGGPIDPGNGVAGSKSTADFNGSFTSFQGFFVEATQAGNVSFVPDMQVVGDNASDGFFRTATEERNIVKLALHNDEIYNEIIVGLVEEATFGDDYSLDATKFIGNEKLSFYSLQGEKKYAIQAIPKIIDGDIRSVDLGFQVAREGQYTIDVVSLENIGEDLMLTLIDNETGVAYPLEQESLIAFSTNEGTHLDRFTVTFSKQPLSVLDQLDASIKVYGHSHELTIETKDDAGSITIHDIQGRMLFNEEVEFVDGRATIYPGLSAHQVYVLQVQQGKVKFLLNK